MFSKKVNLVANGTFNSIVGTMVMDAEDVLIQSNEFRGQRDSRGMACLFMKRRVAKLKAMLSLTIPMAWLSMGQ